MSPPGLVLKIVFPSGSFTNMYICIKIKSMVRCSYSDENLPEKRKYLALNCVYSPSVLPHYNTHIIPLSRTLGKG